jgi:hypothetical protein
VLVAGVSVVDDKTVLEVGKFYNVRCAIMSSRSGKSQYFVPVIGEPHTDTFAGINDKHLHIDGRFVSTKNNSDINITDDGYSNQICSFAPSDAFYTIKEIVIKRLKCKRLTTGTNPPKERYREDFFGEKIEYKYHKWVDTMIGKSCKGKRCPHYGIQMHEKDGFLVCPLHSLKGSITDEVIVGFACH